MSNEQTSVEFSLRGKAKDREISPVTGVPMAKWLEFNREVQEFVQGSDAPRIFNDLQVQVVPGSYVVRVLGAAAVLSGVAGDMAKLPQPGALAKIDRKRAAVARSWQTHARKDPALRYLLRCDSAESPAVFEIGSDTVFEEVKPDHWVDVEQYLIGKIENWGGSDSVNVHLRPRNSKKLLVIGARPEQIAEQKENLVYHSAIVHVSAKENLRTGEIDHYRLIDLRPYQPMVPAEQLQALFAKGAVAWADVKAPGVWVEQLRGGHDG